MSKVEQFGQRRVEDTEWISWCAAHDYVALTKDDRIRRRAEERAAWLDGGLLIFCLTNANLDKSAQLQRFRQNWSAIIEECSRGGARIVGVYADGLTVLASA